MSTWGFLRSPWNVFYVNPYYQTGLHHSFICSADSLELTAYRTKARNPGKDLWAIYINKYEASLYVANSFTDIKYGMSLVLM